MKWNIRSAKRLWKSKVISLSLIVLSQVTLTVQAQASEKLYMQYCVSCHADDGSGEMPGVPDLTEKKDWMLLSETELFQKLNKGFQTPGSTMPMPPRGGAPDLSDKQLLEVIRYLHKVVSINK
ncbi:MAG: cytochrome c [Gammaproteobacteria bacterium]|nr:cytochrome c [Gammaproteobacteria bacterium]